MTIETEKKQNIDQLFEALKVAHDECWKAKIATYDIARKHAPVCVQIMEQFTEALGHYPRALSQRIEKRMQETDGRTVFEEDFWANEDMIITLWERIDGEFN